MHMSCKACSRLKNVVINDLGLLAFPKKAKDTGYLFSAILFHCLIYHSYCLLLLIDCGQLSTAKCEVPGGDKNQVRDVRF